MKDCPIQYVCTKYSSGDNKLPPNNHIRENIQCANMYCEAYVYIMHWLGEKIACKIKRSR